MLINGLSDERQQRIRTAAELATAFLADHKVRKPKSANFAQHALGHVVGLIGDLMAIRQW